MKPFLKYVGRGLWMPAEKDEVKRDDKVIRVQAKPRRQKTSPENPLGDLERSIENNGYRSIKLGVLLKRFGFERRSAARMAAINQSLRELGLYALPEITMALKPEANLQLYRYPVQQLGDLFASERDLEDYVFNTKAYRKLGIPEVIRQYSPQGTKDKLDFKGIDPGQGNIVLELKNRGGGKSAVEQVLRYAGQLKREAPELPVRTILVTGIRNYETSTAISGMTPEQRQSFEWYLYRYDQKSGEMSFERVEEETIR